MADSSEGKAIYVEACVEDMLSSLKDQQLLWVERHYRQQYHILCLASLLIALLHHFNFKFKKLKTKFKKLKTKFKKLKTKFKNRNFKFKKLKTKFKNHNFKFKKVKSKFKKRNFNKKKTQLQIPKFFINTNTLDFNWNQLFHGFRT